MFTRVITVAVIASALFATPVWAQPQILLSTTMARPGDAVTVTVHGDPGEHYAVIGSSVRLVPSHGSASNWPGSVSVSASSLSQAGASDGA